MVAQTVFELDVTLTVLKDDKEIVTLACQWTDGKKTALKGDDIYLDSESKLQSLKVKKAISKSNFYKVDKHVEYISCFPTEDQLVFIAVVDRFIDIFTENSGSSSPQLRCELPKEVKKVVKVHCAYGN